MSSTSSTPQYGAGLDATDLAALDDMRADKERMRLRKNAAMTAAKDQDEKSPLLERLILMYGCHDAATSEEETTRHNKRIEEIYDGATPLELHRLMQGCIDNILERKTNCAVKIKNIKSIRDQLIEVGREKTEIFLIVSTAIRSLKRTRRQKLNIQEWDMSASHYGPAKLNK